MLVADPFGIAGLDALAALGCEVLYQPKLKDQSLVDVLKASQVDVLVVRSTVVGAAALETPSLKLVVRAGAGYNTIDVATASMRGVYVSNCPGKNSIAVAELAFGLILALDRHIPESLIALRWEVEQDRVLEGTTDCRAHVGPDRPGTDCPRNGPAGESIRHECRCLESKFNTGPCRTAWRWMQEVAAGRRFRGRHRECASGGTH